MDEPMTDSELLPCPFCGGAPELVHEQESHAAADKAGYWHFWGVGCKPCGIQQLPRRDKHEALRYWNARAAAGWQTMESAPKDGTEILAWNGNQMTTVSWSGRPESSWGYWRLLEPGSYAEDIDFDATHWAPLPEPPK